MNPTVARGGRSFKGAFAYYMHDKGTDTRERIAWTHTVNLITDDADKAWKVMAYTARNQERLKEASGQCATGRKATKPVLAYSLSWHPEQTPSPDHMREAGLASIKVLGLEHHEAIIIAHSDTPHRHVHIIANRIHPVTGKVASDSYTHRKLSDFALEYAQTHGLTYSPQREANKRKREEGTMTRYKNSKIQEAWGNSDNGTSLASALKERGFELARGNKRLVVVDEYGKIHNPTRHIEGVTAKVFRERLYGINVDDLPDAETIAKTSAAQHEKRKADPKKEKPNEQQPAQPRESVPAIKAVTSNDESFDHAAARLNRVQDRHIQERAAVAEMFYQRIEKEKEAMEKFYRLKEQRQQVEKLREKCETPGFWRNLFGLARRDREELKLIQQSYADSRTRYAERIQSLENHRARATEMLKEIHQREWAVALHVNNQHTPDVTKSPVEHDRRKQTLTVAHTHPSLDYSR